MDPPPAFAEAQWVPPHWAAVEVLQRSDAAAGAAVMAQQKPVVFRGGSIVPTNGWQDLDTLQKTMSSTHVLVKRSSRERVAYFRTDRNSGKHDFKGDAFVREERMAFADFVAMADREQEKRTLLQKAGESVTEGAEEVEVLYCQESLGGHRELELEFGKWDWKWVVQQARQHGWGLPETNVLFMGSAGATTPAHFDEQHNFLNQVRGHKLVVLFPPDDYTRMYPFPVTHPCDRCSMVDVQSADLERFPRFADAQGHVTILGPGDLLYVPYGWWHFCQTLTHLAASVTFWSQMTQGVSESVPLVLGPSEWARVRRNLEKLLADDVGAPNLAGEVLRILQLLQQDACRDSDDPQLRGLRKMLDVLQIPAEKQLAFLVETFAGRFGFDATAYV